MVIGEFKKLVKLGRKEGTKRNLEKKECKCKDEFSRVQKVEDISYFCTTLLYTLGYLNSTAFFGSLFIVVSTIFVVALLLST